jgi:acid stress-induced BolA-like protein IbaG/YrbA
MKTTTGGCGASFTTLVVSPVFEGQGKLKRHRAVNSALKTEIAAIHAWSARCVTPAEWEAERRDKGANAEGPPLSGTDGAGRVEGVDA